MSKIMPQFPRFLSKVSVGTLKSFVSIISRTIVKSVGISENSYSATRVDHSKRRRHDRLTIPAGAVNPPDQVQRISRSVFFHFLRHRLRIIILISNQLTDTQI